MAVKMPKTVNVPLAPLVDEDLTPTQKLYLTMLYAFGGESGCRASPQTVGRQVGLTRKQSMECVEVLVGSGWVRDDRVGGLTCLYEREVPIAAPADADQPDDIFDEKYRVVTEKEISHLISFFIRSGMSRTADERLAYQIAANRVGARKLIVDYGMDETKRVLKAVADSKNSLMVPKFATLAGLHAKFMACRKLVEGCETQRIGRV